MSRLDVCHNQVVNALQKDGWAVDQFPFVLVTETRRAFVDIRAVRKNNGHDEQILLAEVKCFTQRNSRSSDLYTAIGQYLVYRTMLIENNLIMPLYLAVPDDIYDELFDSTIQQLIRDNDLKIITVDLEREVIIRWIR